MCNVLEKEYLLFLFHTKNIKSASDFVTVSKSDRNCEENIFPFFLFLFRREEWVLFFVVIRPDLIWYWNILLPSLTLHKRQILNWMTFLQFALEQRKGKNSIELMNYRAVRWIQNPTPRPYFPNSSTKPTYVEKFMRQRGNLVQIIQ